MVPSPSESIVIMKSSADILSVATVGPPRVNLKNKNGARDLKKVLVVFGQ
jgi:hypothetical protein